MFEFKMPEARDGEKGFTLIEMSIVLVIIGLIIGGVLKGQELIGSTRLKGVITQWDAYKAAANGFQDKFNSLPGDYALATTTIKATGVVNGDGTGIIGTAQDDAAAYTADVSTTNENLNAWAHMAAASLISGVTVGTVAATAQAAASGGVPAGKLSGSSFAVIQGTVNNSTSVWVRIQSGSGAPTGIYSGKDAAEIDRKFDDSNPTAGSVMTGTANANCANATTYNALNQSKACTSIFNML